MLLEGKTAIVTGGGRGLGRAHAMALAAHGARVVVNDPGTDIRGEGTANVADDVVDEINDSGGEAVANVDSCADFDDAEALVRQAVDTYGGLDVLVNNAGNLRDRTIFNMTEDEWDAVINVHLKGHFAPTRHACAYWRSETKAGRPRTGRIISTTSQSGLFGNPGQANYAAAKAGIAALTRVVAMEMARFGVTANTVAPSTAYPDERRPHRTGARGDRSVRPREREPPRRLARLRRRPVGERAGLPHDGRAL